MRKFVDEVIRLRPYLRTCCRQVLHVLVVMAMMTASLFGVSEEEHKSHHPQNENASQGPDAGKGGNMGGGGGMMGGAMGGMMDGMMEKMGAPKPKDLYPSLMSLPDLPIEKREEIRLLADKRMSEGVALLSSATDILSQAAGHGDYKGMQGATDQMEEALALFESGLAANRALSEGQAPRNIAMQWFKREMSLLPPVGYEPASGIFGMSWFHASIMSGLIIFFFVMIGLYFLKMKRASLLLSNLIDESSKTAAEKEASLKPVAKISASESTAAVASKTDKWKGVLCVQSIIQETRDVKTFRLGLPSKATLPFSYLPGQYLQIEIEIDGKPIKRAYTIASSPGNTQYLELTIKREGSGTVSRYLHDQVGVGNELSISAAYGKFTFTGEDIAGVVLISGGVGITPMMSALRYICDISWDKPVYFIFCCRTPEDYIFRDELTLIKKRMPNVNVIATMSRPEEGQWSGPSGRISETLLKEYVPDIDRYPAHICGPVKMMEDVKSLLLKMGVQEQLIHTESFGAPTKVRVPASDPSDVQTAGSGETPSKNTGKKVTFKQSHKTVTDSSGDSILDIAEAAGIDIDNSCRNGSCGMCKVKLLQGSVSMASEEALDADDKKQGVVLACQAIPDADVQVDA